MRDDRGIYYYPNPALKQVRMYVRKQDDRIEFRMWDQDHPHVWDKHEWLTLDVIKKAASMVSTKNSDPASLYDLQVAKALLKSES